MPFWGQALVVDLSSGRITKEGIAQDIFQAFLGGTGLAARLLYSRMKGGEEPLGEGNVLAFVPGLLCASGAPFAVRCVVSGKSPLTGAWGEANLGGAFGPAIKKAGLDAILIKGTSASPVYLEISPEGADLEPAVHLWGKDTVQAQEAIKREMGEEAQVVAIGPAGERRALSAGLFHGLGRAAARCGLGAVMGAKGLKAVAVKGNLAPPLAHPKRLEALSSKLERSFSPHPTLTYSLARRAIPLLPLLGKLVTRPPARLRRGNTMAQLFHQYGTALGLALLTRAGDAPVKNWGGASRDFPLEKARRISDRQVIRYQVESFACDACPVGCGGIARVPQGAFATGKARRPEYEVLAALGPNLLHDNIEALIKAYDLCNRFGMDALEVAGATALAMECFEKGVITGADTSGVPLSWGEPSLIVELIQMAGEGRGLGKLLAEGVARTAQAWGERAGQYAIHIQGQAAGSHHPRYNAGFAAAYSLDAAPGRATAGGSAFSALGGGKLPPLDRLAFPVEGPGSLQATWSHYIQVLNSLGLCQFTIQLGGLPLLELLEAATGWHFTAQGLLETGERIQNLRRLFNLREGLPPLFPLPKRLFPAPDLQALAADYFRAMDWDALGRPSPRKLAQLGLEEYA